jgi:hypothetical protein
MGAATLDLTDLRVRIYSGALAGWGLPSRAELEQALGATRDQVGRGLEQLAAARALVLQPESGEILMANPFSAVPTSFAVRSGVRSWWGNCIWDALGVLAMVGEPGRVVTSCPDCGEELLLDVEDGRCRSAKSVLAHFAVPARHWWDDITFT